MSSKAAPEGTLKAVCFQPFLHTMAHQGEAQKYLVCFAGANPAGKEGKRLKGSESATNAVSENPRNASLTIPIGPGPRVPPTDHPSLAMYLGKFWKPGRELKIGFLSGTDWQKDKVKQYAPMWCQYANLSMAFVDSGDRDILIDFDATGGSWSQYGTDSMWSALGGWASMNLGWIFEWQSEENLRQVILHEFGHALGAVHEHESPYANIKWNKPVVYADLGGPPNNWPPEKVDHNMFTQWTLDMAEATPFDKNSIMLYYYPSSWTLDGEGTTFNTDLSDLDKSYIRFVYPPTDSIDAGQFSTLEIRPANQPASTNTKTKNLFQKYSSPPRLPLGLTSLDIDNSRNIRIIGEASNITNESFTASLNAWSDTILYSASYTYLEAADPTFSFLQTGTFNTEEVSPWQNHAPQVSKRITFSTPFQEGSQPPKVVIWLNCINLDHSSNARLTAYATDISPTGFTAHIDTWADSVMYSAGLTWLAYPADQRNVASGSFSTNDVRPSNQPQPENAGAVSFPGSVFGNENGKVPKVIMALNQLDYDHTRNLRLRVSTSSVTPEGFTWHLQAWADSVMYSAGASYFAWV